MAASNEDRRCGTCKWSRPMLQQHGILWLNDRMCVVPLPIWVHPDAAGVVDAQDDGADCPTWAAKEKSE